MIIVVLRMFLYSAVFDKRDCAVLTRVLPTVLNLYTLCYTVTVQVRDTNMNSPDF